VSVSRFPGIINNLSHGCVTYRRWNIVPLSLSSIINLILMELHARNKQLIGITIAYGAFFLELLFSVQTKNARRTKRTVYFSGGNAKVDENKFELNWKRIRWRTGNDV